MAKAILKGVKIVKVDEIIIPDESDIDEKMFLENLNTLPLPKPKPDNSLPVLTSLIPIKYRPSCSS